MTQHCGTRGRIGVLNRSLLDSESGNVAGLEIYSVNDVRFI
jgi:hypothetical protein